MSCGHWKEEVAEDPPVLKAPGGPVVTMGRIGGLGPALGPWWSQVEPWIAEKPSRRKGLQKCTCSSDSVLLVS